MNNIRQYEVSDEDYSILKNQQNVIIIKPKYKEELTILSSKITKKNIQKVIGYHLGAIQIQNTFWHQLSLLEEIDFSHNKLLVIPEGILTLSKLKKINLEYNQINIIPNGISILSSLESISLSHNKISLIPNSFIKLVNLKNLNISSNIIKNLPIEMGLMTSLTSLNIEGNLLTKIPTTLCYLKNLKEIQFDWFYFLNKNSNKKQNPLYLYKESMSLFQNLLQQNILYCDMFTFLNEINKKNTLNLLSIAHFAIEHDEPGVILSILSKEKCIFTVTNDVDVHIRKTPLYLALSNDKSNSIIDILIEHLDFESLSLQEKLSYLTKGIKIKNIKLIQKISINLKNPSDYINEHAMTPFHYLFSFFQNDLHKSKLIAEWFYNILDNKTINHLNNENWSPMHIAAKRGIKECFQWIFEKNKQSQNKKFLINIKGKEGWTPLHLTASCGNNSLTDYLLQNGANPFSRTLSNKTPRQVINSNYKIFKLLIMYEQGYLSSKFKIENDSKQKKQIKSKSKHTIAYTPSRANINFYKEIFLNKNSTLLEISEAIFNLTFTMLKPLGKRVTIEEYESFVEKTINALDLSKVNNKNILIISGFSNIAISINNFHMAYIYDKFIKVKGSKMNALIKNEMQELIKILNNINKLVPLQKPLVEKKKLNVINLKNLTKNKKDLSEQSSDSRDSEIISNSSLSRNACGEMIAQLDMYNNGISTKNGRSGTNLTNESCNIQDSSQSIIKIENVGMGKINFKNK